MPSHFFKNSKKLFFQAVFWNIFESISYQFLFLIHQIFLFSLCPSALYAYSGSLFSTLYLFISLLTFAIEGGLLPFFSSIFSDSQSASLFITKHLFPHLITIFLLITTTSFMVYIFSLKNISASLLVLISLFIFIESLKKIFRHLLYLLFLNKYVAYTEILQLLTYISIIWIYYLLTKSFSLYLFLGTFILLSTLSTMWYIFNFYTFFINIKKKDLIQQKPFLNTLIVKNRCIIFLNQLTRLIFSANSLVSLSILQYGLTQTNSLVFIHYATNTFTFLIYKICIPPTEAFLSSIIPFSSSFYRSAIKIITLTFLTITSLVIFIFYYHKEFIITSSQFPLPQTIIFIFFITHLLEIIFILYEKFFITLHKTKLLTIINLLSATIGFTITSLSDLTFITKISCILFLRILSLMFLSAIILKKIIYKNSK